MPLLTPHPRQSRQSEPCAISASLGPSRPASRSIRLHRVRRRLVPFSVRRRRCLLPRSPKLPEPRCLIWGQMFVFGVATDSVDEELLEASPGRAAVEEALNGLVARGLIRTERTLGSLTLAREMASTPYPKPRSARPSIGSTTATGGFSQKRDEPQSASDHRKSRGAGSIRHRVPGGYRRSLLRVRMASPSRANRRYQDWYSRMTGRPPLD